MVIIGAGLVGRACAWWLLQRGHSVVLLDPGLDGHRDPSAGSWAALGVLMAQVFHRSSGRGWRLRQQSLQLWGQWRQQLAAQGWPVPWRGGLLLLAASADEQARQQQLVEQRRRQGVALELWDREALRALAPALPAAALGGLHSPADGQLDPGAAMQALLADSQRLGLQICCQRAQQLQRQGAGWRVRTTAGRVLEAEALVLCAGVSSTALLEPLGHAIALEPVLGQALELELPSSCNGQSANPWPGAVVWRGLNLVPRPEGRLWLGATLEPGEHADPAALAQLRHLDGAAPAWLEQATVVRRWQGHRPHPLGRPAPLLEQLEPGLLLATGHYRNGVLLAPATAAWVAEQLERS